jgi:hypothetical protein
MTFSAQLFQKGDEEEIVTLLSTIFNGWPRFDLNCSPVEHWIWKYVENPTKMNKVVVARARQPQLLHPNQKPTHGSNQSTA